MKKEIYVYIQTNKIKQGNKYYIKLEKRIHNKRVCIYHKKSFFSKLKAREEVHKLYTDIERNNHKFIMDKWTIKYYFSYYCETIGKIKNWSTNTYKANAYYSNEFLDYCNNYSLVYLHDIKQKDIEIYLKELSKKELKINSINHRISFLKAIFNKAMKLELINTSPAKNIEKIKVTDKQDTIPFTDIQIKAILNYSKINKPCFYTVFFTALYTGLRRNELCQLEWHNIDFNENKITIEARKTKGKYERIIPLHKELKRLLLSLPKNNNYIFEYSCGGNVKSDWITKTFSKIKKILNLPTCLRFHCTRATFITKAMANTYDVSSVQSIIGHKDLKTTQKYITTNFESKKEIVNSLKFKQG